MRQVFLFSSHSNDSPNLKLFCHKKMPNIVHTYVVKLLLHLLKEKIDLVFDPPPPRPLQIFK